MADDVHPAESELRLVAVFWRANKKKILKILQILSKNKLHPTQ
jgi:hypothetical protein